MPVGARLRGSHPRSPAAPAAFPSSAALTIAVFGHYGNQNLGDESITAAVIQNVRQRLPRARVIGLSGNPGDTRVRHGVDAYPIRSAVSAAEMQGAKGATS